VYAVAAVDTTMAVSDEDQSWVAEMGVLLD
jgi:hypothetical protein